MTTHDEEFYLLALQFVDGLGAIKANLLLSHFSSATAVYLAKKKDFFVFGNVIHQKIIDQIINKETFLTAEREYIYCKKNHINILSSESILYPARLKYLPDKPLILFEKGNCFPQIKKSLAIVGTRKSTEYGHRFLDSLFEELHSIQNLCIYSGLALGIDQKAHTLCLKHKIPTVAVMGLGLNKIYPAQNTQLAKSIIHEGGGWITETSSQDKIVQGVFPRRNRLIAGICDAILVVETDVKGGSIITAHLANEYGKDVFALPGRTSDAQSRGCNDLIQKNIASLINTPNDLIDAMSWNLSSNKKIPKTIELDFEGSEIQKNVLDVIRKTPKIELERILNQTNLEHSQLVETLLELELEGLIHTLPGNKYELI